MSSSAVYDTIKNHLVTQWGATYPVRDWEQIETLLQQETNPWLALEDGAGSQDLISIGTPTNNFAEDRTFVIIHAFVPSTQSLASARTIADAVRADLQFQHFTHSQTDRLRTRNISPPTTGIIHDGLWHSMILTVDIEHQYVAATAAE